MFGYSSNAWFDIACIGRMETEDVKNIEKSSEYLISLIENEHKNGIPLENIIIGGFSQGGAIAYYSILTCKKKIGGAIILSSWLPNHQKYMTHIERWQTNKETNMFIGHGASDNLLEIGFMHKSVSILHDIGYTPEVHEYPDMAHTSSDKEIYDVKKFLDTVLSIF
ncbi:hypothetical protein HZS_6771 [Henneguya salminicola]|nr:hypothetical protein HZS_6771 [Henneguya salminicola]